MKLTVNGTDILPFLDEKGIKWTKNDIDGPDAGRTMDGRMHRSRVACKAKLELSCRPLPSADAAVVLNLLKPQYVTVSYTDPMEGSVSKTMYAGTIPATVARLQEDGTVLWEGIAFSLIER